MSPSEVHTTVTCGISTKATRFSYFGSLETGIVLHFKTTTTKVGINFIQEIITEFRGKTISGGFSMTAPKCGGLGIWVREHSRDRNNGTALTPRHASFIAAVLRDAGKLTSTTVGNAVILKFHP